MPLALGMFVLAIALVGVVSVAKARGALPHTKFSIGQKVTTVSGTEGTVTNITVGTPVVYDLTLTAGGIMTRVPEAQLVAA